MTERGWYIEKWGLTVKINCNFLSPRQEELFLAALEGQTYLEIACNLGICEGTVKNHFTDIAEKIAEAGYPWAGSPLDKFLALIAMGVFEIRPDGTKVLFSILDMWKEEGSLSSHTFSPDGS